MTYSDSMKKNIEIYLLSVSIDCCSCCCHFVYSDSVDLMRWGAVDAIKVK